LGIIKYYATGTGDGAGLEAGKGAKAEMENLNAKVGNGYV